MKQILFTILLVTLLATKISAVLERYDGSSVYQIELRTQQHVDMILKMQELRQIDVWSDNVKIGPCDVRVPKEMKENFSKLFFGQEKLRHELQIPDVQKLIDVELKELAQRTFYTSYKNKSNENDFFKSYHRLSEIEAWTRDRIAKYPQLASLFNIGKSHEGRDQLGIRITGGSKNLENKPSIFFHGAIHAREWVSPTTVMWIANELLTKYESDSKVKYLVDNMVFYITPVANPDGYEYTHTTSRMWRKTREPISGSRCVGVDPNRNFEYKWNTGGSSSNPCSDAYHGPKPLSAVETRNIVEFGTKQIKNLRGYIDFHAYTQLYMRPWGFSRDAPKDEALLKRIGDAAAKSITDHHRQTYRSGRIAVIIYVASGSSADHFYGNLEIPSYGIELRPATARGGGFMLPPAQIIPTGEENFEGLKTFAEMVLDMWVKENSK